MIYFPLSAVDKILISDCILKIVYLISAFMLLLSLHKLCFFFITEKC